MRQLEQLSERLHATPPEASVPHTPNTPPAPQASPAIGEPVPASPAEAWSKLLERIQSISSFAWVDKVTLGKLDLEAGLCTIRPRPGQRDIGRFVGQRQRERLGGELTQLLQRPIRVELDAPKPSTHRSADTPGRPATDATDRQKAIGLPLVRDVLDVFPDAVLMDTRREQEPPVPEPDDTEVTDDTEGDSD